MEGIKLYRAWTTVESFPHRGQVYKDVSLMWHVVGRDTPPVPYEELIQNYSSLTDSERLYAEESLLELFTEQDLQALQQYLLLEHDCSLDMEQVALPSEGLFPYQDQVISRSSDFYMLAMEPEYSLPFQVQGFYHVEGHERPEEPFLEEQIAQADMQRYAQSPEGKQALEGLFPTEAEQTALVPRYVYHWLGVTEEEELLLEKLASDHALTVQQLLQAFIRDLIGSELATDTSRAEMARQWLQRLSPLTVSKKGWAYLWKASS
jgi:hypothetical protein